jgi:hypothetical protein
MEDAVQPGSIEHMSTDQSETILEKKSQEFTDITGKRDRQPDDFDQKQGPRRAQQQERKMEPKEKHIITETKKP